MKRKIISIMTIAVLGMAGIADAAPDSNSIVKDNIEYYIQTDKFGYHLGEQVEMLYRVTNLRDEDVTFGFPGSPEWNFWVERDGENIWTAVEGWYWVGSGFTLAPSEYKEYPYLWDMRDHENNLLVNVGGYSVIGGLDGAATEFYDFTRISVGIKIVPEPPKTYYVDAVEGSDDNDGLGPQTAFATIQKAIDAAFNGDTVLVADGTYTGPGNRDIDFLGKAITVRSESGPENCIIDCNGTEQEWHRGFYFHSGEGAGSVLEGFSITNALGGANGIYCKDSSPTITNCIVTNGGIGIRCSRSNPTISNCIISGNFCIGHGGGIFCYESSPTITNCTISGNWADCGGGISCYKESNPTIINCTISGNSTRNKWGTGGGIYCGSYSSPTITNSTITNNWGGMGGGIYNSGGNPTFTNCTFIGNSTEDSGGAIYCYNSNSTIANCTISSNTAKNGGGGIYCHWYTIATITNCRFTGNSADFGGGINCCSGSVTITNCTFSGNSARRGGAIKGDDTTITNCIFWGDTPDEFHGCWGVYWRPGDGGPPWLNVTFSNVQGGYEGEGNIDSDPCFLDPGYWDANDTPDDANDDFWVEGDYHLLRTSPCIDAANDANVYTDIEGNIRPFDFPGVDNNGELPEFDMGAYELVPVEAAMKFTPQMLNCNSKGKYIKAHFTLPEGFLPEDVDVNESAIAEPMGIESEYIKVIGNDDGPVRLEICFDREAFCAQITETGEVEMTIIGSLTTGRYFYASDTIKIKP